MAGGGRDAARLGQAPAGRVWAPAVPTEAIRQQPAGEATGEPLRDILALTRRATLLPTMSTGASDMAQLRTKGIQSYGIGPAVSDEDRAQYGAHGDVERLSELPVSFRMAIANAILEDLRPEAVASQASPNGSA